MTELPEDEFERRPELVKQRARVLFLQRIGAGVLIFYMVLSMTVLLVNAVASYQTRGAILDCTQPSGGCYQNGQQRTGDAVQNLKQANKQVIIAAAYCSSKDENIGNEQRIKQCVNRTLISGR